MKILSSLRRIYRLFQNPNKQNQFVWDDIKKCISEFNWQYTVYEKQKYIELFFRLHNDEESVIYQFEGNTLLLRSLFLMDYPEQLTSDFFILATHLNNILTEGIVTINIKDRCIDFMYKQDVLRSVLYIDDLKYAMLDHLRMTDKIIYPAFHRLIYEQESPAIIIADLVNKNKN